MIGKTISHYRIIEKLGEGGMGIVYKAQDLKLDRFIALKFLPPHLTTSEEEKQRFIHEAKAASSLDHNNICAIYEIDETRPAPEEPGDGQLFISMAYYEGETLDKKIKEKPLPIDEAIDIAIQVAQGLAKAHKREIVHRDIKPANIMLTKEGVVKVLDFGLAKLSTQTKLTKDGTTLGTVAYMSPEQAKGEDVDQRSDIWSLGVVLYEMLAGTLPFKGDYEQAVIFNILNEEPSVPENKIPDDIAIILQKALAKNPDERYATAEMLINDLKQIQSESRSNRVQSQKYLSKNKWYKKSIILWPTSILIIILVTFLSYQFINEENEVLERIPIAVIDFENKTNEKELNGLSGMLITALEQSRWLTVVTRSRMFDILGQMGKKDIGKINESIGKQICQQANISAMVIASVRKFGSLYTIDLKVLDPEKDEYLFTAKEDGEGQESIPAMLDNLSEKTRAGLKERAKQIKESNQSVASVTTTNLEAYQHFFLGEQLINQLKFNSAIDEFKKAVVLDSSFAQAYYRLAYAESWQNDNEVLEKKHLESALKYINKMPERERYLLRAQDALSKNDDYKKGIVILKEMEQIYPEDKEMIYNIGDWSYHINDYTTAAAYLEKTIQINPNHQRGLQHLILIYGNMENYDKMLETAKRHVAVSGSAGSYESLGNAYIKLGQFEKGQKSLKQARDLFPDNYRLTYSIANFYVFQDKLIQAEVELKKLVEEKQSVKIRSYGYGRLSEFYSYQGKYRKAIHMLDKRIELLRQVKDTVNIAINQIFRGYHFIYGWNDVKKAWQEVEKTISVQNKSTNNFFWGCVNFAQVYHGDYKEAVRLSKTLSPHLWQQSIQSLIFSLKGDEENAEAFADSVIQTGSGYFMMFVLYPLAQCQYENGHFDKALESLNKMQNIYDTVWIRGIYYPKSYYLMGKIYEKKGDTNLAIKIYEKFLELWKDADNDLPDLIDAKARYAKLKELVSK